MIRCQIQNAVRGSDLQAHAHAHTQDDVMKMALEPDSGFPRKMKMKS